MNLTVVTHTQPSKGRDISRSVASVQRALPVGAKHAIIECEENFIEARWEARKLDEFICFVDDDDYISPGSLSLCMKALRNTSLGIAFTDEVSETPEGKVLSTNARERTYGEMAVTPMSVHHLCVMRTSAIYEEVIDLAKEHKLAIEWLMKATAGLIHGAVHVPIIGYHWVHHPEQHSKQVEWQAHFRKNVPLVTPKLQTLARFNGPIPQLVLA